MAVLPAVQNSTMGCPTMGWDRLGRWFPTPYHPCMVYFPTYIPYMDGMRTTSGWLKITLDVKRAKITSPTYQLYLRSVSAEDQDNETHSRSQV